MARVAGSTTSLSNGYGAVEEVYLHAYCNGREAQQRLRAYFETYNSRRLHQALEYRPPDEVYFGTGSAPVALAA